MSRRASCSSCEGLRAELGAAQERIAALEVEGDGLRAQLLEATHLVELQRADIERYKAAYERIRPNTPERVPTVQLQLAFEQVLTSLSDVPAAQHLADAAANDEGRGDQAPKKTTRTTKKANPHGRRRLDLTNLPVENIVIDPDDVVATQGEGFELVDEEVSDRIAFKPSSYVRLRIVRRKWARKGPLRGDADEPMVIAPVPASVWPSFMADPSAVAAAIIAKYDDSLPLHRQERISARNGFRVPRSTQCGWLGAAFKIIYRIVDAMFAESLRKSFCIATDATGAPVRTQGGCENWHIFVFIADHDHVLFRYTREHSSEAMQRMLGGFRGHLLADAAPVYDTLYRDGAIEVACWFHARRYFWRALPSDPQRALQALSLIAKLFEVQRDCLALSLPMSEYTALRAERSKPILDVFDQWVERNRDHVDPRGPLDKAIGYYDNQREALHRFLCDGRLRLDNCISEQQLRYAVLGRHNWMFFMGETGLKWYAAFRSLIASCRLHNLNAHEYIEQVLRLAPHWPVSRVLKLSPKYWTTTCNALDEQQRRILIPPWRTSWPRLDATAPPEAARVGLSA